MFEMEFRKEKVTIDRPFQVGIVVYQLAKMRMCSFAMIVSTITSIERILSSSRWTPTTCILGSQAKHSKKQSGRSFSIEEHEVTI